MSCGYTIKTEYFNMYSPIHVHCKCLIVTHISAFFNVKEGQIEMYFCVNRYYGTNFISSKFIEDVHSSDNQTEMCIGHLHSDIQSVLSFDIYYYSFCQYFEFYFKFTYILYNFCVFLFCFLFYVYIVCIKF